MRSRGQKHNKKHTRKHKTHIAAVFLHLLAPVTRTRMHTHSRMHHSTCTRAHKHTRKHTHRHTHTPVQHFLLISARSKHSSVTCTRPFSGATLTGPSSMYPQPAATENEFHETKAPSKAVKKANGAAPASRSGRHPVQTPRPQQRTLNPRLVSKPNSANRPLLWHASQKTRPQSRPQNTPTKVKADSRPSLFAGCF